MPRGKPIAMIARQPIVPRGTDFAPLIEAMTAQTIAITKLAEAMGALAAKIGNPMMVAEPANHLSFLNSGPADRNATIGGPDPRLVPRYGEPDAQPQVYESADPPPGGHNPGALFETLAADAGLGDEDPVPEPDTEGMWRTRMQMWGMKLWQPAWGPEPGKQGCEVPAHLLNGRSR